MTTTHGKAKTRLYRIWLGIRKRCYNPNETAYRYYGAKGIKVCDEWKEDFEAFGRWAEENGYADELSIDRVDVKGDYTPGNCRWATEVQQANNKSNNRPITIDGETHNVAEWARIKKVSVSTIANRLHRGWEEQEAVLRAGR